MVVKDTRGGQMCTEKQLVMIETQMVESYRNVFGNSIIEI